MSSYIVFPGSGAGYGYSEQYTTDRDPVRRPVADRRRGQNVRRNTSEDDKTGKSFY